VRSRRPYAACVPIHGSFIAIARLDAEIRNPKLNPSQRRRRETRERETDDGGQGDETLNPKPCVQPMDPSSP
jgi:hypothetical protein